MTDPYDGHEELLAELSRQLDAVTRRRAELAAKRDRLITTSPLTGYRLAQITGLSQSYVSTLRRAARLAEGGGHDGAH